MSDSELELLVLVLLAGIILVQAIMLLVRPAQSYVTKFHDEFEYHIREKRCDLSQAAAEVTVS